MDVTKLLKSVPLWVWIAGAAGVALYLSKKGVQGVVADVTAGAINGAGGVVIGALEPFGIPRTSETKCQKAMREGNNWDASFYCDAATFLAWQKRGAETTFNELFGGLWK